MNMMMMMKCCMLGVSARHVYAQINIHNLMYYYVVTY